MHDRSPAAFQTSVVPLSQQTKPRLLGPRPKKSWCGYGYCMRSDPHETKKCPKFDSFLLDSLAHPEKGGSSGNAQSFNPGWFSKSDLVPKTVGLLLLLLTTNQKGAHHVDSMVGFCVKGINGSVLVLMNSALAL